MPAPKHIAAQLQREYQAKVAAYNAELLASRKWANFLELVAAVCVVFAGSSATAGLLALQAADGLAQALPHLVGLTGALVTAYIGVCQPRQRQAQFAAASSVCAAVAKVAEVVVGNSPLTTEFVTEAGSPACKRCVLHECCIAAALRTLEATALDDQPPLQKKQA